MPKVTKEYLSDKKNYILECTEEIVKEKPLYLITMRDIIKKAGFSQGVIYRYYSNLDDIYVDFINKHTTSTDLQLKIDSLLNSVQPEKTILADCLTAIGDYIAELLESVVGKTFFELLVMYTSDSGKRTEVFPKLKFRQSLEYAQKRTAEFALRSIEKGVFRSRIPFESVLMFVSIFTDGVSQHAVFGNMEDNAGESGLEAFVPEMFKLLANIVLSFLEE